MLTFFEDFNFVIIGITEKCSGIKLRRHNEFWENGIKDSKIVIDSFIWKAIFNYFF